MGTSEEGKKRGNKDTHKFLSETNDFDSLRRLLRSIYMYGSRSTQDMVTDGISRHKKRRMDDFQKSFSLFFNTEDDEKFFFHNHPERKQDKRLMKMRHDRFTVAYNYLAEAYVQHTVSPTEIISFVYLLEAFRFMRQARTKKKECLLPVKDTDSCFMNIKNSLTDACAMPTLTNLYVLVIDLYNMSFEFAAPGILDNSQENAGNEDNIISQEQFRAQLNKLYELGYLKRWEEKGTFLYGPVQDVFDEEDEELKKEYLDGLDLLTEFFCDHSPVSIPGYYLREKVLREKNDATVLDADYSLKTGSRCFLKNARLQNILDDDTVWTLLSYIRNLTPVSYVYSSKDVYSEDRVTALPIKIVLDKAYGRSYLFCRKYKVSKDGIFSRKGEYAFHRTDRIFDIKEDTGHSKKEILGFMGNGADNMPDDDIRSKLEDIYEDKKKNSWTVSSHGSGMTKVLIHFRTEPEKVHDLMLQVDETRSLGEITDLNSEEGTFDFRAEVRNYAEMIPWVAGFGSLATVDRTESPELYSKIIENSREALKLYGQSL